MKNHGQRNRILILAYALCLVLLSVQKPAEARDLFTAGYIQTLYNQNNEIGSNEVNCVCQTKSGYVWVGTEGGLYRSDGSGFSAIYLWDENRADLYSISCLMQDKSGCVWIGTSNYGLFYFENGEVGHFRTEYYDGIKDITAVCETENGQVYVATSSGLFVVGKDENGKQLLPLEDEETQACEYDGMVSVGDEIWALHAGKDIYVISDQTLKYVIDLKKITKQEATCISKYGDQVYCGTAGGDVIAFSSYERYKLFETNLFGVQKVMRDQLGRLWIGAEDGIGYINKKEKFISTGDMRVNSYISDIMQDYEGNYWIASSRTGLLFLAKSKFVDFNMQYGMAESMVNCVCRNGGLTYIGTDDGLNIYNGSEKVSNDLTEMLTGVTIRDILTDSRGILWIATERSFGLIRVNKNGEGVRVQGSNDLPSTSINCVLELKSGKILLGTRQGLAMVDEKGNGVESFNDQKLLSGISVLCLYQDEDGTVYAGTDGYGIYAFPEEHPENTENYNSDSGLNSNVVTEILGCDSGLYIATDDGLSFYKETFRSVSNIEHSNSIYDIEYADGFLWMIGSMGILRATDEELLGSNPISDRYHDMDDGLNRELNAVGHSYIDEDGILYICCNNGLYTLNTRNIPTNLMEPRIKVTAVVVDGKTYEFEELVGGLTIPADASRIEISFAVYSYSNRKNIEAEYKLTGFDETPIIVDGKDTMVAVYTNLAGGEYQFEISAKNADGTATAEPVSFTITKNMSLLEKPIARVLLAVLLIIVVLVMIAVSIRVVHVISRKDKEIETLAKEHEEAVMSSYAKNDYLANMSNEIKTPINAMMAKADELMKVMGEEDAGRDNVQSIYEIGENILGRVDDIILLAKLEAGSIEANSENYSISSLMYDVSEYAVGHLGDKNVKILVEIGDVEKDYLRGDEEKLRGLLERLVDNAIYTTKDGSITLSVDCYIYNDGEHKNQANVVFTVSDTGIGIPEDMLEDVFKLYNAEKKKTKNSDAGLAIAKGYADILGGDLSCDSVYGAGSTFTLALDQPLADLSAKTSGGSKIEGKVSKEIAESLWLPDVSVLLVDDDDVSLDLSKNTLSTFEMKIDVAKNGMAAIDMVMNHEYDVVFLDVSMPVMNGLETMKEIRELSDIRFQTLPIIAMDVDGIESNKETLITEGFTDSLIKPIEIRRLAALLKDCLPESKISEKSSDTRKYIEASRYGEGLLKLESMLELDGAIEKIGGSIEVYNKLIVAFFERNQKAVAELLEKRTRDKHGFKMKVHNIRMGCTGIGAYELAKDTSLIESAVSRSDNEFLRANLEPYCDSLSNLLLMIEDYIGYMYSVSGMTDEEYAKMHKRQKEEELEKEAEEKSETKAAEKEGIDATLLEDIRLAALDGDLSLMHEKAELMSGRKLVGEDADFMEALKDAVDREDVPAIDELVTTYKDLKM